MEILREAERKGLLEEVTRWQLVDLEQVEKQLSGIQTETDQIDYLQLSFPCLYFYVCDQKGISTAEFMEECKEYEYADRLVYFYFIHGWLIPRFSQLRDQGQIKDDQKQHYVGGDYLCNYQGPINVDGKACGIGYSKAVKGYGQDYSGCFWNDRLHGNGKFQCRRTIF